MDVYIVVLISFDIAVYFAFMLSCSTNCLINL